MSNIARKLDRNQKKIYIEEFKKNFGFSNQRLVQLCIMEKKKVCLNGKIDVIMDLQIKAMEKKYADTLATQDISVISDAEIVNG